MLIYFIINLLYYYYKYNVLTREEYLFVKQNTPVLLLRYARPIGASM